MIPEAYIVILAAVFLDLIFGDPLWLPHPVRWMGRAITLLEPRFRRLDLPLIVSGALMTFLLIGASYGGTAILIWGCGHIHPALKPMVGIVLVYYCISMKSLEKAARDVSTVLETGDLPAARQSVGWIVGRDTQALDADGVRRAVVETVAENFVDGVAAPLFYAVIGGPPLALAYKMINTLDSMVGYKNARYRQFGKVAARLDDGANFLPARLSLPAIWLAAHILARAGGRSFRTALAEGAHHSSPNAGYPEAAFAGALAVRLNGPNYYGGVRVDKPYIGRHFGRARHIHIQRACDLMLLSSLIWVGFLVVADLAIRRIF